MKINWYRLLASIAITEGAGGIGSIFTFNAIPGWYASLNRGVLSPPNWIFAPMWITLFFLMGIAFYIVWNLGQLKRDSYIPLILFFTQLILNVLWSFIFFGQKEILFGVVEIVFLWFFILATSIEFREVSKAAGYLFFPYISWVTVATMLNLSVLIANP